MSAVVTIACNRCGSQFKGGVQEAIAWNNSHDEFCAVPVHVPEGETNDA